MIPFRLIVIWDTGNTVKLFNMFNHVNKDSLSGMASLYTKGQRISVFLLSPAGAGSYGNAS